MIYAVIGIWVNDQGKTFYVKRSQNLTNYKGTWSLLSIRCDPEHDVLDLDAAHILFQEMSRERLDDTSINVVRYLTSGSCNENPMNERVVLHLYQIEPSSTPALNSHYYTDARWMYLNEYQEASKDFPCGLCTRLWTDYAARHGMAQSQLTWEDIQPYQKLVEDTSYDSYYLREQGLKPNIIGMVSSLAPYFSKVLDVGSGTGWLSKEMSSLDIYECDVAPRQTSERFCIGKVTDLPYPDDQFSLVIASMVLCWEEDLNRAAAELARVTQEGGSLVIALPHPVFYQTGTACDDGSYSITKDYNSSWAISDLYIGGKVGPLSYFHRPIHQYVNAFVNAGYQVSEMREWSVDQQHYLEAMQGKARRNRTGFLPVFLFLAMTKP